MKRKSVALFLPYLIVGGIERLYITYANHLARIYDVTLIVCSTEGEYASDINPEVSIVSLDGARIRSSLFRLIKVLRKYRFDLVMGSNMLSNIILILASFFCKKTKIIVAQHNYNNSENKHLGFYSHFSESFFKFLYPKADKVLAVSKGIEEYLVNDIKISPSKVEVVYNAIDINDVRRKSNEFTDSLTFDYIIFVGRLTAVKNIPLLLSAFEIANIGNINLVIVGDGPEDEFVKKQAQDNKKSDKIHFIGAKSNPMPYIRGSRCLVLPSTSESFGLVLLEALCLGTPVVSTPTKGALEVLDGCQSAYISSSFENPHELALLIEKAVEVKKIDIVETVNRFSIESSIKNLSTIFDKLMA